MARRRPTTAPSRLTIPFSAGLAIGSAAVFTIVVGIFPGWLIEAADTVTNYAR